MKILKKAAALLLAAAIALSSSIPASAAKNEGRTLKIVASNELIKYYLEELTVKTDIPIKVYLYDKSSYYYENLGNILSEMNNPADIFVTDPDNIDKYLSYAVPLADLGIKEKELKNTFACTRELCSDSKGVQRAAMISNSPGYFMYDRDIAKKVFGTDDPDKIQEYVSDWDKFLETAEILKKNGYYMLADVDEMYYAFDAKTKKAFVSSKGKVQIDSARVDWINYARKLVKKGYTPNYKQYDYDWFESLDHGTDIFGWFSSEWFTSYADFFRDYQNLAACPGPQGYIWGGHILAVSKNSDNYEAAAELIRQLCLDGNAVLKGGGVPNNMKLLKKSSIKGVEILGGQELTGIYRTSLSGTDYSKRKKDPYKSDLEYDFKLCMHRYIDGKCSYKEALGDFKEYVKTVVK